MRSSRLAPWIATVPILAVSAMGAAPPPEDRLDATLKLLYRARHAERPSSLTDEGSREAFERLVGPGRRGSETGTAAAHLERRLSLLVRYVGDEERLREAGFEVQARVGGVYTGTLALDGLPDLLRLSEVRFVQASRRLRAAGAAPPGPTRSRAGPRGAVRAPTSDSSTGAGALIAYVDTGADIFHEDFRNGGTTRIKYLLDLSDPGDVDDDGVLDGTGPFGGTLYTEADINAALASSGTVNQKDTTGHGTHGLSVAAGDDGTLPGLAPAADLIVVKATREDGTLGFWSADIVNALAFVDEKAAELGRPYVANLSLGTLFSSHDGRSLEEQAIDALVGPGIPGKAVVVAAGNASDNRGTRLRHLSGRTLVGLETSHALTVPAYTPNPDRGNDRALLDLWYEGRDRQSVIVRAPASRPDCPEVVAPFGDIADLPTPCGDVFVANLGGPNPSNGDIEAIVLLDDWSGTPPAAGEWTIALRGEEIGEAGTYHGWLAEDSRVGATEPFLSGNADNLYLVGKPGGAYHAITVGSFARHQPATRYRTAWTDVNGASRDDDTAAEEDISDFSSSGPTRDGRTKPELAAPGERVMGAVSRDAYPTTAPDSIYRFHPFPDPEALIVDRTADHAFGLLQGTSFSAPVVTGLVARVLSEDPSLDAIQARNILINSAATDAFTGAIPNPTWGYGKVNETVGGSPLPSDLRITVDVLPPGAAGKQYNLVLTASGGTLPYAWAVSGGALPPGLTLEGRGFLTGVPTAGGSFDSTIRVSDSSVPAKSDSRDYRITIAAVPPLAVVTFALPVARIEKPYEAVLEAEGGAPPYVWSFAGGDLPLGVTFLANGLILGTPETLGAFNFTARVQDAEGAVALRSFRLRVLSPGGDEWDPLGKTTPTVNQIAVDPNDPDRVFVSTRNIDAVFETTNGGDSWRATSINNNLNTYASELRMSPSSTPWALTFGFATDGTPLGRPYRFDAGLDQWIALSQLGNPTNPTGLDFDGEGGAFLSLNNLANASTFLRTTDGGTSWASLGVGCNGVGSLSLFRPTPALMFSAGQTTCITEDGGITWADVSNLSGGGLGVRVSQRDPFDVVKVTAGAAWRSVDGGRNWTPSALRGSVCCLDRSPTSPTVVLAGTSEGVFKSSDGGQTWRELRVRSQALAVTSVAVDPSNADNYYVGSDQGVFHSADGGVTWALENDGLIRRTLRGIALSRSAPSDVLLVAAEGPYVSRTSGEAWTLSREGLTSFTNHHPVVSPADPNLYYVANDEGVFRSDNRGVTWYRPDPSFGAGFGVVALEADPFDGNVVMASLTGTRGTYRSGNRGETWSGVNAGLPFVEPTDLSFAADVPGRVYVAFRSRGVYRSENGGSTWAAYGLNTQTVEEVEPAPTGSGYLYARSGASLYFLDPSGSGQFEPATTNPARPINDIAVDPADRLVAYAGADHSGVAGETGGVYKTTDGGRSWVRLPGILDSFDVVSVATHPTASGTVYAATLNAGVYRSTDGGLTWTELANYGTVAELTNVTVQDPTNPLLLFAGTEGYGVQVSTDRGKTFTPRVAGLTNFFVNAVAFDPDDPTTLYVGTDAGIFRSADSGATWAFTGQTTGEITDVATDNEGVIRRIWGTVNGQGVAVSEDGGASFAVHSTGLASLELTSLEVEVRGAVRRIWGTTRGGDGVVYSDDLGLTWVSAAGNGLTDRNVNDVAIERGSVRRIWGTTDSGVFFSENDGLSWTELSLGLPSGVPVSSVAIDPNTNEVLVSLFSEGEGGVYRGGNVRGIWSPFSRGLGELRVRRLTSDGGHVVDATTMGTTFFAATAGDGVYASEIRTAEAETLAVTTAALPDAVLRTPYAASVAAQGGAPPYSWSIALGTLPPGITLDAASGGLAGEPGQAGSFPFTVQVSDASSRTARQDLAVEVRNPDVPALAIDDVSLLEGDTGSTDAVFTVSLSRASGDTVTVGFATGDLTAAAGVDYTAAAGTLTFAPGTTSRPIAVALAGDVAEEPDEAFSVNLSGASGAVIARSQGIGTIRDDDAPPRLSIGDVTVAEGNTGTVDAIFTVTLSRPVAFGVTVEYATADGTATAPADYQPASGTLTFIPPTTSQTVTVNVNGDVHIEPDETFVVALSDAANAVLDDGEGQATILDEDGVPALSVGDVTVGEGAPSAVFPVSLSTTPTETVTVGYATSDGTAVAGTHYQATTGTVAFLPGERERTIVVPLTVPDDGSDQEPIAFFITLANPAGATVADGQATATIVDDDTRVLSIDSPTVTEGTDAVFTISLNAPSVRTITVDFTTVPGTATAGADYQTTAGTLTFAPGMVSQPVSVPVLGNLVDEPNEAFMVVLSNPTNAVIAERQGPLDMAWTSLGPTPPFPPGHTQNRSAYDSASDRLIVVQTVPPAAWVLENALANDATSRWRALAPSGPPPVGREWASVAYDPGSNRLILHGGTGGGRETWVLTGANGLGAAQWIRLPDYPGNPHSSVLGFYDQATNRLIVFGGHVVDVGWSMDVWVLEDANGLGDPRWSKLSPSGSPPHGRSTTSASVVYDPGSNRLILFGGDGAPGSAANPSGLDNDLWVLTDANGLGGLPVWSRLAPLGTPPGPRLAGAAAYDPRTNQLYLFSGYKGYFGALVGHLVWEDTWLLTGANGLGEPPRWMPVPAAGPAPRYFGAATSGAEAALIVLQGGNIASGAPERNDLWFLRDFPAGTATILDDDPIPTVSVGDASVSEGDSGLAAVAFGLSLSGPSERAAEVGYATADGTARAGPDYAATSGSVTIPAGQTAATVTVLVKGDVFFETDETFFLDLTAASNATIGDGQGLGTILNDDVPSPDAPVPHVDALDPVAAAPGGAAFSLRVTGANFQPTSRVRWNGSERPTSFVSARELRATIPASDVATAGVARVSVLTPAPGGGRSGTAPFVVSPPAAIVSFAREDIPTGTGSRPVSVATADLDADGRVDVVTANHEGDTVSVLLGNGDGTFRPRTDYPGGDGPYWVHAADLDADGDLDVAVANYYSSDVSVFPGNGDGTLAPRFDLAAGVGNLQAVVAGDFNRDGRLDLAAGGTTGVSVLLRNVDGSYLSPGYVSSAGHSVSLLAAGDFNGDGRLDLLAPGASNDIRFLAGNGEGVFSASTVIGWCCPGFRAAAGDLNRDGALDFAWTPSHGGGDAVRAAAGNNAGNFNDYTSIGAPSPFFPALGDFNADGTLDVAVTNVNHASMSVSLGFGTPTLFATGVSPYAAATADFDGDGRMDVATANYASDSLSLLTNAPPSSLAIDDVSVSEGNLGGTDAVFTVTLSPPSDAFVTVSYATADGTATAGSDYVARTGVLTFLPGETTRTVTVTIFGDATFEPDETLFLDLSGVNGAVLADGRGRATIVNDDSGLILSVEDVTVVEGDSGTPAAAFTVSMPAPVPAGQVVTVAYTTADGTATASADYQAVSGVLTFDPGQSSRTVMVPVVPDSLDEPDETFTLNLSGASGAVIADAQGVATIQDDDDVTVSVGDVTIPEGDSGLASAVFAVSLSAPSARAIEVGYATADDTARAGPDYVATSGSVSFPPGSTSATIGVPVRGDLFLEPDEAFLVNLTTGPDVPLGDGQGRGTIRNDDAASTDNPVPALHAIDPVSAAPGSDGFELRVLGSNLLPSSVVRWNGADRATTFVSARELRASILPADLAATGIARVSVFSPAPGGGRSEALPFVVSPPTVAVSFSRADIPAGNGPRFVAAGDLDGDGRADLVVANHEADTVSAYRGNGDGTFAPPVARASGDGPNGIALADLDQDGDLDLAVTSLGAGTVSVFLGDGAGGFGARSDFDAGAQPSSVLAADFNADGKVDLAVGRWTAQGVGVLLGNGDGTFLSPGYDSSTSGYWVSTLAPGEFTGDGRLDLLTGAYQRGVQLLAGSGEGVFASSIVVDWCCFEFPVATADFNRDGALDLLWTNYHGGANGVSVFFGNNAGGFAGGPGSPGLPSPYFPAVADFNADGVLDSAWTNLDHGSVSLLLGSGNYGFQSPTQFATGGSPRGAAAADFDGDGRMDLAVANHASGTISILTNTPPPSLTVSNASVGEGNALTIDAVFTVTLAPPAIATVTVNYATADGTATAGSDYVAKVGSLTFLPGETTKSVPVTVFGDTAFEPDETFFLDLSGANGADIADGRGEGTIANDDTGLALSVSDVTVAEGDTEAVFTVSMPMPVPSGQSVSVSYATADETATAGFDYQPASGTVTLNEGESSKTVAVPLLPDALDEADEALFLHLGDPSGALIADGQGRATITDDDPLPTLSIGDATVAESGPVTSARFTVTLSPPSGREVRVSFATADGSAHAGTDYLPASGTLVFAPGMTARTVDVAVVSDAVPESEETFFVDLSAPVNAAIGDGQGQGTIVDEARPARAHMTSPAPGSALPGSTVTFEWSPGVGALRYWLSVGTTPGGTQIYDADQGLALSRTVTGIPTDGATVHVLLWTLLPGGWQLEDYSYRTGATTKGFYTVTPCRLVDTRTPADGPPLAAGAERAFVLGGRCGLPAAATSVSINIAVTQPTAGGSLTLYPGGAAPVAMAISYGAGQTRGNNGVYRLSPAGELSVRAVQAAGSVHLILDVNGYFVE